MESSALAHRCQRTHRGHPRKSSGTGRHCPGRGSSRGTRAGQPDDYTFVSTQGTRHRIDYICAAPWLAPIASEVGAWKDLDNFSKQRDRIPVLNTFQYTHTSDKKTSAGCRLDSSLLGDPQQVALFQDKLKTVRLRPWEVPASEHMSQA
eukprot:945941-Pyramimonas_sp.AAC.1